MVLSVLGFAAQYNNNPICSCNKKNWFGDLLDLEVENGSHRTLNGLLSYKLSILKYIFYLYKNEFAEKYYALLL